MLSPPMSTLPSTRAPGIRSFIRLKVRKKLLLPHPDGPMIAVTRLAPMDKVTSLSALNSP